MDVKLAEVAVAPERMSLEAFSFNWSIRPLDSMILMAAISLVDSLSFSFDKNCIKSALRCKIHAYGGENILAFDFLYIMIIKR